MASGSSYDNPRDLEWDEELGCFRVDGCLRPDPLIVCPPSEDEAEAEPNHVHNQRSEPNEDSVESRVLETKYFSCRLFRREKDQIILETNEVNSENKSYYVLKPLERGGKRRISTRKTHPGETVLTPVVGEIFPDFNGNKTNLSIEQRLEGEWKYVLRRRRSDARQSDRYYSHKLMRRNFQSLCEVATFIGYNIYY